jgi:hypothetical protein
MSDIVAATTRAANVEGVQLMVGMKDERHIKGVNPLFRWFLSVQSIKEVISNAPAGDGMNGFHTLAQSLVCGHQLGDAFGQTDCLAQAGIQTGVTAIRVPVPQRRYRRAQHLHRGCRFGKHAQYHHRFDGQFHATREAIEEGLELHFAGQSTVPQQVSNLFEIGLLGELDHIIAPVEQSAFLPIDEADAGLGGENVLQSHIHDLFFRLLTHGTPS